MAGDWLKFEKATLDKPEVFAIADALGLDPDTVLGKLIRVWSWFDSHTVDGNARRVTSSLLNRVAGNDGFIEAMAIEGWATIEGGSVQLPNFDRHNGETAKKRALTAKRVAKSRAKDENGNAQGNDASVTSALAREEKRREDLKAKEIAQQAARDEPLPDGLPSDIPTPELNQKPERMAPKKKQTAVRFPEFWAAYPVKKGKADALKKWKLKGCDEIAEKIIAHVRRMEREDEGWKTGYIPHGSTYINGERWDDEPTNTKGQAPAPAAESFGAKASIERASSGESKLDNEIAHIKQRRSWGGFGDDHASADAAMARAILEARAKYGTPEDVAQAKHIMGMTDGDEA